MRVKLSFVPPGGGEQDYMAEVDLPGIPRAGDAISVQRKGMGHSGFIVRSVRWNVDATTGGPPYPGECRVFAEFADFGELDGDGHKRSLEMYRARGKHPKDFPNDGW